MGFEVVVELRLGDEGVRTVLTGEFLVVGVAAEVYFEFDAIAEGVVFVWATAVGVCVAAAPAVVPATYYAA